MKILSSPDLNVVLVEPQIPPNTGNIARLCAAAQCHLILVGDLGFELSDRYLKRAGLDYWDYVSWEHVEGEPKYYLNTLSSERCHLLTTHSQQPYTHMSIQRGDYFFFGKETAGLPKNWLEEHPQQTFTIPMWEPKVRSLNLSSAVSIIVYDALRRIREF
ncbi:tRNA (cytidine(34)-2'-O)-methyltransferase [Deltaproteobacteria bacterium TL4]